VSFNESYITVFATNFQLPLLCFCLLVVYIFFANKLKKWRNCNVTVRAVKFIVLANTRDTVKFLKSVIPDFIPRSQQTCDQVTRLLTTKMQSTESRLQPGGLQHLGPLQERV